MNWLLKAALTATMVVLVMAVARGSGRRLAGVTAALPTITAPALAWLVHERGMAFAVDVAIASISACAMLALFSVAYAMASRRRGKTCALACGLAAALGMAWPAFVTSDSLVGALMLALACSALAIALIPVARDDTATRRRPNLSLTGVALVAGGVTALAATAGPVFGSFATGLLASLPVISATVAMVEHADGGHVAAANFLGGYARGLFGKAAFGAVFVLLAPPLGAAMGLAAACASSGLVALIRPGGWPLKAPAYPDHRRRLE